MKGVYLLKYLKHMFFIACITMFLFALFNLTSIFSEYKSGENEYDELTDYTSTQNNNSKDTEWVDDLVVNFDELKGINSDFVGWIKINDTVINYPVVKGTDNNFYLHKTFYKKDNFSGAIFINCDNVDIDTDKNTIFYGHNMNNGTMFSGIRNYQDQEYWETHKYIQLYTHSGNHIYKIYSAYKTGSASDAYKYSFANEDSYSNYLASTVENSLYNTGVTVSKENQVITLSTCVGDSAYRFVIHAVKIK